MIVLIKNMKSEDLDHENALTEYGLTDNSFTFVT